MLTNLTQILSFLRLKKHWTNFLNTSLQMARTFFRNLDLKPKKGDDDLSVAHAYKKVVDSNYKINELEDLVLSLNPFIYEYPEPNRRMYTFHALATQLGKSIEDPSVLLKPFAFSKLVKFTCEDCDISKYVRLEHRFAIRIKFQENQTTIGEPLIVKKWPEQPDGMCSCRYGERKSVDLENIRIPEVR